MPELEEPADSPDKEDSTPEIRTDGGSATPSGEPTKSDPQADESAQQNQGYNYNTIRIGDTGVGRGYSTTTRRELIESHWKDIKPLPEGSDD